jgi:hypothetical protein
MPGGVGAIGTRWIIIGALALATTTTAIAQSAELQRKLAVVKQAAAENKLRLQRYQWIETTRVTFKGSEQPPSQNLCHYGLDGQVQKTPIAAATALPSAGRNKQGTVEEKKAELDGTIENVKGVLGIYVPPDPQTMQQDYQAGKSSLEPVGDILNFVFRDYAQPGDRMTLSFDPAKLAIIALKVNTYLGESKDAVTLQVQMASLPDGTNHVQRTVLDAAARQLVITTTNSGYQKLGGQ